MCCHFGVPALQMQYNSILAQISEDFLSVILFSSRNSEILFLKVLIISINLTAKTVFRNLQPFSRNSLISISSLSVGIPEKLYFKVLTISINLLRKSL